MIRITTSVMDACLVIMERIMMHVYEKPEEMICISIYQLRSEDVLEICTDCGWIAATGIMYLMPRGIEILDDALSQAEKYTAILCDYILTYKPIWSSRIPYGRKETMLFLSEDEQSCFSEAELLSQPPSERAVNWWDSMANSIRQNMHEKNIITGRNGEKLTIEYEHARTGKRPVWMSVESNTVGYDVQSIVDTVCDSQLLIEVKATNDSIMNAQFHVTSHEWYTSRTAENYIFHLWLISKNDLKLAVISPDSLAPFIPTNNNEGKWESAIIPYIPFERYFKNITLEAEYGE